MKYDESLKVATVNKDIVSNSHPTFCKIAKCLLYNPDCSSVYTKNDILISKEADDDFQISVKAKSTDKKKVCLICSNGL